MKLRAAAKPGSAIRRRTAAAASNGGKKRGRKHAARQYSAWFGQDADEQRTRVSTRFSQSIDRMNVRPLSRSQISVSIGATIPRSVRAYAVPRDIVAIYPRFRGHRFVVVDDEIVIVEPGSQRVVTTLPMGGERGSPVRPPGRRRVRASARRPVRRRRPDRVSA